MKGPATEPSFQEAADASPVNSYKPKQFRHPYD